MTLQNLNSLKDKSIDLIISDLDDTLVRNVAVSYVKKKFFKHPIENLAFLAYTLYEVAKFPNSKNKTLSDLEVNLFKDYVNNFVPLDEILDFVEHNKSYLILEDAKNFLDSFQNSKKVLATRNFEEVAYEFKDDFKLDEIYANILDKRSIASEIINHKKYSVLILGDSKSDLQLALEVKKEGLDPIVILRGRLVNLDSYKQFENLDSLTRSYL
ncbi:MAG: hypothetical protein PWP03_2 [Candidatus Woesearchaeota archaeon]|nr:hypothetical protein [Candidatus Woesearchaeota archaeon]MDN5327364.1 hypothetical protein [Candidatus Woesearchaeota archaeon]